MERYYLRKAQLAARSRQEGLLLEERKIPTNADRVEAERQS